MYENAHTDTHQLVTGDETGVLKLWDLRNFGCVQTFEVKDSSSNNSTTHGSTGAKGTTKSNNSTASASKGHDSIKLKLAPLAEPVLTSFAAIYAHR